MDTRPWDLGKIQGVPAGRLSLSEQRETGAMHTGAMHTEAWASFCIFLSNLGICILWYFVVYDSRGTANPGWTYVFG